MQNIQKELKQKEEILGKAEAELAEAIRLRKEKADRVNVAVTNKARDALNSSGLMVIISYTFPR